MIEGSVKMRSNWIVRAFYYGVLFFGFASNFSGAAEVRLGEKALESSSNISTWVSQIQPMSSLSSATATLTLSQNMVLENCEDYPYMETKAYASEGYVQMLDHIKTGLNKGLQCLAGMGSSSGKLHDFHRREALKLMEIIESKKRKTLRCVKDEIFAFAVSKGKATKNSISDTSNLDAYLQDLDHPGIVFDLFRIGGYLSQKHDMKTLVEFYGFEEAQASQHLAGRLLQENHRYGDLAGLHFHEMIHWLGHEHSIIEPDVTFLYDTCCFDGSDFIDNNEVNKKFQKRACDILRDDELWSVSGIDRKNVWQAKNYGQIKIDMKRFSY